MEQKQIYILFSILRSVFHSNQMSDADKQLITDDLIKDVIKLASKHDVAHLIAIGILNNNLVGEETKPKLQQIVFSAIYRYERLNYELNRMCEILEAEKIPFIPLKGSVIRQLYPEPWMRTSCDIDVLVQEQDLDKTISCLERNCDYTFHGKASHEVSMFSKSGVHIEIHYDLIEKGRASKSNEVLSNVWKDAIPALNCEYHKKMSDVMYYFYHIAHMAKHFECGGCGIRPFIDLWILDGIAITDKNDRNELLNKAELFQFAHIVHKLSSVWMDNLPYDSTTEKMENYILTGGVYGTLQNKITVQQQKKGGKFKYAISKIIIPYDTIKFHYPILQKHRWLTPIMQVRRWFKLIFCGHAKRSMRELSYNSNISRSQADEMKIFLDEIGL